MICVYLIQEPGRSQMPGPCLLPHSVPWCFPQGPAHSRCLSMPFPLRTAPPPPRLSCALPPSRSSCTLYTRDSSCWHGPFQLAKRFHIYHVRCLHKQVSCDECRHCHHHHLPGDSTAWRFTCVGSAAGLRGVPVLALPPPGCVMLDKVLNLSVLPFSPFVRQE